MMRRIKLASCCEIFRDVFATHRFDIGKISHERLNVKIDLEGSPAPCSKPYRLGEKKRRI